jgi:lipopolysaccharide/colanic/teichoic acid biosynthesis glycosyltransferase
MRSAPDAPAVSPWLRRRLVVDRVAAMLLSVATAPIVAALAVLIRRQDGHAALIRVPRVGRDGRVFGMWKLRSMRVETSDGRAGGASLTSSADERITPLGHTLRALHADELPQLYNVAMGQMCLLGPRPEAPEYVDHDAVWAEVLAAPPGIAGPTQLIVGEWERTEIDADTDGTAYREVVVPVKAAIDRWYVQHASARIDLLVVASLVRHVAGRDFPGLRRMVRDAVPEATAPLLHLESASEAA